MSADYRAGGAATDIYPDVDIFGAHLQDLPTSALTRVVVGGYIHVVPMVVDACVEELCRRGQLMLAYNLLRKN